MDVYIHDPDGGGDGLSRVLCAKWVGDQGGYGGGAVGDYVVESYYFAVYVESGVDDL